MTDMSVNNEALFKGSDTFNAIKPEKRERVTSAIVEELWKKGIAGAKVEEMAKRVGISYGSMYTYFPTKDHMVRYVLFQGLEIQNRRIQKAENEEGDVFSYFKRLLVETYEASRQYPGIIAVWVELGLAYNERFNDLFGNLEEVGFELLVKRIEKGIVQGEVSSQVDPRGTALIIDSLIAALLKSHISTMEERKGYLHFGEEPVDAETAISPLIKIITGILKEK